MTFIEKTIAIFKEKFTIANKSSHSGIWWKIPLGNNSEVASPVEVEQFIRESLLNQLKEIAQKHFDDTLGTYDYDGIAEEVLDTFNSLIPKR